MQHKNERLYEQGFFFVQNHFLLSFPNVNGTRFYYFSFAIINYLRMRVATFNRNRKFW